jgi:hypothetical protein
MTVSAVRAQLEQDESLARLAAGLRREKALNHVLKHVRVIEA